MWYRSLHADEQLLDRYGVIANTRHWRHAFLAIVDGHTLLLSRNPTDGVETHITRVRDVAVPLVYDPHSARVITVLPPRVRLRRY